MSDQHRPVPSASQHPQDTRSALQRIRDVDARYSPQVYGLQADYYNALSIYCAAVSFPLNSVPPVLSNPLVYFYSLRGHRNCIFTFSPFTYGVWESTKVSKRTFPSFLRFCGIADGPPDLRDALFDALQKFVQNYPYDQRFLLMKEFMRVAPDFAQFFFSNIIVSSEQNLYFRTNFLDRSIRRSIYEYSPLLSTQIAVPRAVNRSSLKRYLSLIVREQQYQPSCELSLHTKSILFYGSIPERKFQSLCYNESGFVVSPLTTPQLPVKALPYLKPPDHVPPGATAWLFRLTGGDTEQVDRLAQFLARAASPASSGCNMTVVCTRENPEPLIRFFSEALSPLVLKLDPLPSNRAASPLPSLNQFCHSSGLMKLFSAQGLGQGAAFVRDIEVSDTARPVLKKLLSGRKIALSSPYLRNSTCTTKRTLFAFPKTRKEQKNSANP